MLLHPFPIHPLLCSVPPPPLPFPPQRVLSSDRTVNHTLSAGLILCVCVCACAHVCPDVHLHFQKDWGSVFLTSIFHSFLFTFFSSSSSPVLYLSHLSHLYPCECLKKKKKLRERQLSILQPQCIVDIDSVNVVSSLVYFHFGKCLAWLYIILFNSEDMSINRLWAPNTIFKAVGNFLEMEKLSDWMNHLPNLNQLDQWTI